MTSAQREKLNERAAKNLAESGFQSLYALIERMSDEEFENNFSYICEDIYCHYCGEELTGEEYDTDGLCEECFKQEQEEN